MPSAPHLTTPVRVVFASGIAELNDAMLQDFNARSPAELPLVVVAEFAPPSGEWIPWHVRRSFAQNLESVKTALAGRQIKAAAVAWDTRSALSDLRRAARELAPSVLTSYDEDMRTQGPGSLAGWLIARAFRTAIKQIGEGGRVHLWMRRLVHPSEAEIPIRARLAQARGLAAARSRVATPPPANTTPRNLAPGITVVIPTRDGRELLREMLPPLIAQLQTGEIIVVDNGSRDGTTAWLAAEHPAIRILTDASPLSFAAAVNRGIAQAKFARLLLLNNDMIVEPGFTATLNAAFSLVPELFCATAQILFPQGIRREETGKAMWRKTSELDFPVRCEDPLPGEDLTWVLYGSGGCSLFDTAKLRALGGVAELYDPAYVEDMDFGLRAWKRGWPSVYCDGARVEHRHRSTTARFYTERQIDFFVERNYLRFIANVIADRVLFEKLWTEAIRRLQLQAMQGRAAALDTLRAVPAIGTSPETTSGHLTEAEILSLCNGDVAIFPGRPASRSRTVLVASPYLPYPLSHGGAVRIYNLLLSAAESHNLILVAFADTLATPPAELLGFCSEIVLVVRHGSHYRAETTRPDMVEEFDSPTFRASLKQAVHQWQPAIAQLEFTWMAQYADACRPAKTILVEHDITFDLQTQLLSIAPPSGIQRLELEQQLTRWRSFETAAWTNVDCVVTMSTKDAAAVTGARFVECLPNGVDTARFQPFQNEPDPNRLLLIGSFAHLPNLLALDFFLREVWPRLANGYTLHVIGGSRHEYYLEYFRDRINLDLSQPNIELEGFVSDVRGAYARAGIVIAPLTASAGTNIKVLEALAMGKALISTPAGVNGLDITPGTDYLLAADAEEFANHITQTASDPTLRHTLEQQARQTALNYDWRAIGERQQGLYKRMDIGPQPGP